MVGVFFHGLLVIFTSGYCQREDKSKVLKLIWNIILTFLAEAESNNGVLADYDIGPVVYKKTPHIYLKVLLYSRILKLLVGFEISLSHPYLWNYAFIIVLFPPPYLFSDMFNCKLV